MKNKLILQVLTVLVILLCVFLSFSRLTSLEIRMWDEARNAVNALEMIDSGFSLLTTYDWKPDHWNTKPPLLIWIQALSIKILGLTELAVRLPSIICALAFIPIIISLGKKWKLGESFSLFTLICLFTFPIFLFTHSFRTGDYDGLLTLCMFSYSIFYIQYLRENKHQYLVGFFICFALAFLTKGIAGFLFLPALFLITLLERKLKSILSNPWFYIGIAFTVLVPILYYFFRNQIDPGYWESVVDNELGGRFLKAAERHTQPWYFYFHYMRVEGLQYFTYFLAIFIYFSLLSKKTRKLGLYCLIIILSHFIIISYSQTKLYWYALPEVPFIALMFGLGWVGIQEKMLKLKISKSLIYSLPIVFLLFPVYNKINYVTDVNNSKEEAHEYCISKFLIENMEMTDLLDESKILVRHYSGHVRFYVEQYEDIGGSIEISKIEKVAVGDKVLVSYDVFLKQIWNKYKTTVLKTEYGAFLMHIDSEKEAM